MCNLMQNVSHGHDKYQCMRKRLQPNQLVNRIYECLKLLK